MYWVSSIGHGKVSTRFTDDSEVQEHEGTKEEHDRMSDCSSLVFAPTIFPFPSFWGQQRRIILMGGEIVVESSKPRIAYLRGIKKIRDGKCPTKSPFLQHPRIVSVAM